MSYFFSTTHFGVVTGTKTLRASCRPCLKVRQKKIRVDRGNEINKKRRDRRVEDPEWRDSQNASKRATYADNPETTKVWDRNYKERLRNDPEPKERNSEKRRLRENARIASDPELRVKRNLRTRIHTAIIYFAVKGIKKKIQL